MESYAMKVIARIESGFASKFGVPRQSGLVNELRGRVIFEPPYRNHDAVRGLEGFSHIWLIWAFDRAIRADSDAVHAATRPDSHAVRDDARADSDAVRGAARADSHAVRGDARADSDAVRGDARADSDAVRDAVRADSDAVHAATRPDSHAVRGAARADSDAVRGATRPDWSPTVRPPRLGGNRRVGVFATRSPFRPNPLGLSCVELERVETDSPDGPVLHVRGADLVDGTPIFDIKPYLAYADARPDAVGGYASAAPEAALRVEIAPRLLARVPETERAALIAVLAHDPRPRYQNDPRRVYGFGFAGCEVKFRVCGERLEVVDVTDA